MKFFKIFTTIFLSIFLSLGGFSQDTSQDTSSSTTQIFDTSQGDSLANSLNDNADGLTDALTGTVKSLPTTINTTDDFNLLWMGILALGIFFVMQLSKIFPKLANLTKSGKKNLLVLLSLGASLILTFTVFKGEVSAGVLFMFIIKGLVSGGGAHVLYRYLDDWEPEGNTGNTIKTLLITLFSLFMNLFQASNQKPVLG